LLLTGKKLARHGEAGGQDGIVASPEPRRICQPNRRHNNDLEIIDKLNDLYHNKTPIDGRRKV